MNDLRKAAEMALEVLETTWGNGAEGTLKQWEETIQALRQALTPEVTPEVTPEGWVKIDEVRHFLDSVGCGTIYKTAGEDRVPLYSAPQREWVGLTHDEVMCIWYENGFECMIYAKAIEAKLKEKNVPQP